jgi:hypothetical protein
MCRWIAEVSRKGFVLLALAACGSDDPSPPPPDPCNGVVTHVPTLDSPHVPEGSTPEWNSNPPTSGPHYAVWAAYDQDYADLARGYWLHDLEHGAVVYAYRCDAGCPEVAAQLDAVVKALPPDGSCTAPVHQRALVVADPLLPDDHTVAAVAWGTFYVGQCADLTTLRQFYYEHAGHGPENLCSDGAALGGTPIF